MVKTINLSAFYQKKHKKTQNTATLLSSHTNPHDPVKKKKKKKNQNAPELKF